MSSSGAPSSGGSFSIDLDRAPEAIKELKAARDELVAIRTEALKLGRVDPGSRDSVSADAAARLSAVAVSGPGSFVAAMNAGVSQVESLIRSMQTELDTYRSAENENESTFRG